MAAKKRTRPSRIPVDARDVRALEADHATLWDGQPMHETGSGWGH